MTKKSNGARNGERYSKELEKRIQIIDKISDEEFGFAVKNNLIKWWELKAWQESNVKK